MVYYKFEEWCPHEHERWRDYFLVPVEEIQKENLNKLCDLLDDNDPKYNISETLFSEQEVNIRVKNANPGYFNLDNKIGYIDFTKIIKIITI